MSRFGPCDMAEAMQKYTQALHKKGPYDRICFDVLMPVMDGFEVLKQICQCEDEIHLDKDERAKIIMITTFSDKKTVDRALQMGCNSYIVKPFSHKKLLHKVQNLGLLPVDY